MGRKYNVEIISEEEIYEPTGKFQESGREVIYTNKTRMKIGKYNVTVISNEPSPEALKNGNKVINRIMQKYDK